MAVRSAAPRRHLRVKHLYPRNLEALLSLRLLIELLFVDGELVHVLSHALLRLEGRSGGFFEDGRRRDHHLVWALIQARSRHFRADTASGFLGLLSLALAHGWL